MYDNLNDKNTLCINLSDLVFNVCFNCTSKMNNNLDAYQYNDQRSHKSMSLVATNKFLTDTESNGLDIDVNHIVGNDKGSDMSDLLDRSMKKVELKLHNSDLKSKAPPFHGIMLFNNVAVLMCSMFVIYKLVVT